MNEIAPVRNDTAMAVEPEMSNSMVPMQIESEAMTGTDVLDPKSRKQRQILVIISSTVLTFTGCGLNFAYGVYQDLYETMDGPFAGASTASIDLIGTLAVSLMTLGAPFASAWTKTYGPRSVTLAGGLLSSAGMITASFSKSYWQFLCTQGLLLGLGTCLSYMPAVTVAPSWFDQRRGLAMGIILSGTGIGGVAWAPFLRYLNASIGFRNALRIAGGLMFVLTAASALVLKWEPVTEAQRRVDARSGRRGLKIPKANWNIVRTRAFAAHASAAALHAAAYCTPVYFFSTYARTLGYSTSAGASFIALSNACNCIGKILLGFLADRYGRLNALVLCTLLSAGVTLALWLPSSLLPQDSIRRGLFVAFTCLYGFTASAYVSLFPTALAEQFGVQNFASINGLLYMLRGMGTLVGTPVAGALVSRHQITATGSVFGYEKAILLVAALLMGATFCVVWARVENGLQGGWKWKA